MHFISRRRTAVCVAGFVGIALVAAPLTAVGASAAGETVDITLLNINDFHGRIDSNTVKFAGTVETLRAAGGVDNTLFLSDGDNIGASVYASSSAQDEPTLDVLNALDLDTSAVGNHEFDQGFDDLTGRVADSADWNYLGANVYNVGTTTPALKEYEIFDVEGVRVAVVGAVTEETPSLVSPGGISTVEFGDPVEAVNRVVTKLKADDAADVFVAEYHEGAAAGSAEGSTLADELAIDSAFTEIVTETSAEVDAIFTGHTHKKYAWEAQVPGAAEGVTRPVLQTGSYGENIGQIELTVDVDTDAITDYTVQNVARLASSTAGTSAEQAAASKALDDQLIAAFPRVAEVNTITKAALAAAEITGSVVVGNIAKDITTAYVGGTTRDDRASESSLGNLVADSLVDTLKDPKYGSAEIGVVNPGGLRAELKAGDVTYSQANAVLPFANNLWTTTLTGAQFKTLLEQQWQRTAAGTVPSRSYLQLGLSKNVSYTYDASLVEGSRITSISVNNKPIDPEQKYRIGTFSFLLDGGDNFHIFRQSTDKQDTTIVDRDAWIDYITENSPLSPSFARRAVAVSGAPTTPLDSGFSGSLQVSKLNLTSLGSPVNTSVTARFEGSDAPAVKSKVAADGSATVFYSVPRGLDASATLLIVAKESGTTVRIPVTVNPDPVMTGVTPTITGTATVGSTLTAVAGDWTPSGTEFTYQWRRNNVAITGATASTYKVTTADAGARITVVVTGSNDDLPAVSKASAAKVIAAIAFTKTATPSISGTAKVGKTLKASIGTWSPAPTTVKYTWKRNGATISGATSASYKVRSADTGKKITVTVTASKPGYVTVVKTSAKTATVKK